jgi:universal stress protein E
MNPIRRILVAVKNPMAKALPAVAKASQLAKALGAEIVLFQSLSLPAYLNGVVTYMNDGLADAERCTAQACERALESVAQRLRRRGIKTTVRTQFDSPIYEAVIREASRSKADLIVAEQHHGHRGASLLHLTDWELLRLTPVPVLLVKNARPYRKPKILAAIDPDHTFGKPAWLDREILNCGSMVADALHGTLHAMHAYAPIPVLAFPNGAISQADVVARSARSEAQARKKLLQAVRDAKVSHVTHHVIGRHPADAIAELAGQTHSSLVVMGAISRSGFKRLLIGNTAERVLDHLVCDVLIIKPRHLIKPVSARRGVAVSKKTPRMLRI